MPPEAQGPSPTPVSSLSLIPPSSSNTPSNTQTQPHRPPIGSRALLFPSLLASPSRVNASYAGEGGRVLPDPSQGDTRYVGVHLESKRLVSVTTTTGSPTPLSLRLPPYGQPWCTGRTRSVEILGADPRGGVLPRGGVTCDRQRKVPRPLYQKDRLRPDGWSTSPSQTKYMTPLLSLNVYR